MEEPTALSGTEDAISVSSGSFCKREEAEQWGGVGKFAGGKVSGLISETCGFLSDRTEDLSPDASF